MNLSARVTLWLAPPLAATLVRALGATLRITVIGAHRVAPLWASERPIIYAMWHGQLLMLPFVNEKLRRTLGARAVHVLASRSRDGELLARFVGRFGLDTVRGSSSRAGMGALRSLARRLRDGYDVAIAPDGPRGPRGTVHPGALVLARITEAPVVPVAFATRPAWRLSTWDQFEVPRPFGRGAIVFGDPLYVTEDHRHGAPAVDLQAALAGVTAEAEHAAGDRVLVGLR